MKRIDKSDRLRHWIERSGHTFHRAACCTVALPASACSTNFSLLEPAALIPRLAVLEQSRSELPFELDFGRLP